MLNKDHSFVATTSTSRLRLRHQRQPKKIKRELTWSRSTDEHDENSNLELKDLTAVTTSVEPGSPVCQFDQQAFMNQPCSYFIPSQKLFKSKRVSKVFGVYLPNCMSNSFQSRRETNKSYLMEIPMDLLSLNDHPVVQGYRCHLMASGGAFDVGTYCRWALFRDFCCAKGRQRVAVCVSKRK